VAPKRAVLIVASVSKTDRDPPAATILVTHGRRSASGPRRQPAAQIGNGGLPPPFCDNPPTSMEWLKATHCRPYDRADAQSAPPER